MIPWSLARSQSLCLKQRPALSAAFSLSTPLSASPSKQRIFPRPKREDPNYNSELTFDERPDAEKLAYRRVTANDLETQRSPPTKVKMLVRDFIEDSLYNPHYGYFPKQATIVGRLNEQFDFCSYKDSTQFQEEVAKRYAVYGTDEQQGPSRQMWHTPTELFKPWYGRAIAQCLVSEYLLKYFPYEDFIIYEIGAGNGTLAMDILNFLRQEYPDVYDRTHYNIIEISGNLAQLQRETLCDVHPCTKVYHQSIFQWNIKEPAPCFFVAMEVIDNFAHDILRYDLRTLEPYQGYIAVDANGDFSTFFTRVTDPLISSFLRLRRRLFHLPPISKLLKVSKTMRKIFANLPFAPNLSAPEYIPTRLLSLLRTLRQHFPRHRLLISDFASLPDTIPGVMAPVVQTRYQGTTVPCSTLLVQQGYFDIFFPTNFERLRDMYEDILSEPSDSRSEPIDFHARISPLATTVSSISLGADFFSSHRPNNMRLPLDGVTSSSGLPIGEQKSSVFSHAEFLETYADLSKTRLKNGENPMLDFYQNVKILF